MRERISPLAIDRVLFYLSSGRKQVIKYGVHGKGKKQKTNAAQVGPECRVAASV
jgi:hypothetical protein